ncbi:hypothetical protein D3C85_1687490 [compost metagenome]
MTFVDMVHIGINAQCSQCFYATDAQHHFLGYAHVLIATVKLRGQRFISVLIGFMVSI